MNTTYSNQSGQGRRAETQVGNWIITTRKPSFQSGVRCSAILCDAIGNGLMRFTSSSPQHALAASDGRATEAEIRRVHAAGLEEFRKREPAAVAAMESQTAAA